MRVSMKLLRELVDVTLTPRELADKLDMTGTAVEAVIESGSVPDGVVVGQVVAKERHPDADKLWVTRVDVGADEPLQVVCGAQNFEAGDKVPVALVGTTLPNGMTIKAAKLRGVESAGMNCSAPELGVPGDGSGLLILPADAPVGVPFAEYHGSGDTVLELEITPNRADCMSVAGVAREVGAVLGLDARMPASTPEESGEPCAAHVGVRIEDPDLCPRYTARLIRGVRIGPSPDWLAEKVAACGARPINNIVDVTNYVMFELGQPLHAFDAAKLATEDGRAQIIVRRAREGERMRTLDGADRVLTPEMLLICDPNGAVALAGVMGGENTEVSEATVDILLESASFASASTGRTSRSLGLVSEASIRFERGVDPGGCVAAADRAAQLMAEVSGGTVAPGVVDEYPRVAEPRTLELRVARMNAVLGTELSADDAAAILRRLGLTVDGGPDVLTATVPTFRPDLEREIDLVEEVVRVYGMERVPGTLPASRGRAGGLTREQRLRERAGEALREAGLNETMTYSFIDPADLGRLRREPAEGDAAVELLNPMSVEQSVMRPTIACGLLRSVSYNQRRGVPDVHLYEIGAVFVGADGRKQPKEREVVAGALAGVWARPAWSDPAATPNSPAGLGFFDGKGAVETLTEALGVATWKVRAADRPWLQPGRSAEVLVGDEVAGWLGEVHPDVCDAFEAAAPVVLFELELAALLRAAVDAGDYRDVPRFPAVELDVALVVDEDVTCERLEQSIRAAGGNLLESVRLFDVYRGKGVADGRKSVAFALAYRAPDRTLTDDEVRAAHDKVVRKVSGAVGAELRG
ncbi:MAG: phenylalanine--tRNA ligase subunit beta [Actinobacteria bacterium]|nr:MAG: phenylalanine--tRNA ligase subunit beta [Actinomycetota bacterium]